MWCDDFKTSDLIRRLDLQHLKELKDVQSSRHNLNFFVVQTGDARMTYNTTSSGKIDVKFYTTITLSSFYNPMMNDDIVEHFGMMWMSVL